VRLPAPGPSPRAKRLPVETASTLIGWRVNFASPPFAPQILVPARNNPGTQHEGLPHDTARRDATDETVPLL